MTTTDRAATARAAADALTSRRAEALALRAVAGFDAMVDSIVRVVDVRTGPDSITPMARIEQFAARINAAAGKSINIELAVERVKIGGNGVLMADGLATLGLPVGFIGNIASESGGIHPVFNDFVSRCASAHPTSPPGATDACEFTDGKVMVGKTAPLKQITWVSILTAVGGEPALTRMLDGAALFIPVSWTQVPHMTDIWQGVLRGPFASIPRERRPWVFVDLADPAKRTDDELRAAMATLRDLAAATPLCLGLNLAESQRMARTVGAPASDALPEAARALRAALGFACVVVHRREGAAAATERESTEFAGPFTRNPRMSTGAGDNFNAGFALGWRLGLPIAQALALGCATSGLYVRKGEASSLDVVAAFLHDLPAPEA